MLRGVLLAATRVDARYLRAANRLLQDERATAISRELREALEGHVTSTALASSHRPGERDLRRAVLCWLLLAHQPITHITVACHPCRYRVAESDRSKVETELSRSLLGDCAATPAR